MNENEVKELARGKICPLLILAEAKGLRVNKSICLGPACAWWKKNSPSIQEATGEQGRCVIHNI